MPEEFEIETKDLQETLQELQHEREERAEEEKRESWLRYIALSTALLAVVAAVAALQSGSLVNEALIQKQEAGIAQASASDQWTYYQAKGIKANLSGAVAAIAASVGKPAEKWAAEQKRYKDDQAAISSEAKKFEKERDAHNEESKHFLHAHHTFAYSVTLLQVAIALSAVAALTRKRYVWYLSMIAGIGGLIFFGMGFYAIQPQPHSEEAPAAAAPEGAPPKKGH